jgi:hypothetical protein
MEKNKFFDFTDSKLEGMMDFWFINLILNAAQNLNFS